MLSYSTCIIIYKKYYLVFEKFENFSKYFLRKMEKETCFDIYPFIFKISPQIIPISQEPKFQRTTGNNDVYEKICQAKVFFLHIEHFRI